MDCWTQNKNEKLLATNVIEFIILTSQMKISFNVETLSCYCCVFRFFISRKNEMSLQYVARLGHHQLHPWDFPFADHTSFHLYFISEIFANCYIRFLFHLCVNGYVTIRTLKSKGCLVEIVLPWWQWIYWFLVFMYQPNDTIQEYL